MIFWGEVFIHCHLHLPFSEILSFLIYNFKNLGMTQYWKVIELQNLLYFKLNTHRQNFLENIPGITKGEDNLVHIVHIVVSGTLLDFSHYIISFNFTTV